MNESISVFQVNFVAQWTPPPNTQLCLYILYFHFAKITAPVQKHLADILSKLVLFCDIVLFHEENV